MLEDISWYSLTDDRENHTWSWRWVRHKQSRKSSSSVLLQPVVIKHWAEWHVFLINPNHTIYYPFYRSFQNPVSYLYYCHLLQNKRASPTWSFLRGLSFADFLHLFVIHDVVALENSTLVSSSVRQCLSLCIVFHFCYFSCCCPLHLATSQSWPAAFTLLLLCYL